MRKTIEITDGVTRMPAWRMKMPVNFELLADEQLAVVGNNASGKSMFVDIITGKHPLLSDKSMKYDFFPSEKEYASDNIKYIKFKDTYGTDTDRGYYMQQRWNQGEIGESAVTVATKLANEYNITNNDKADKTKRDELFDLFRLDKMMDKKIISLSSGELRKLILAISILNTPRVLIIDNPFIGLDVKTREMLRQLLKTLIEAQPIQLILVLNDEKEIPDFVTHVVEVRDIMVMPKQSRAEYFVKQSNNNPTTYLSEEKKHAIINMPYANNSDASLCKQAICMNDVTIGYGNNIILNNVSWHVGNEEHWSVVGENGSGKSTLLSIVCADNPQSYACDITLFDKKRGSGESIWDIKKHIGYVSPELHRAFKRDIPAINIVMGGFNDTNGSNIHACKENKDIGLFWMDMFGIAQLANRTFFKLSSGEQRLVLLARAFVKDPELLILDEPLHGLDKHNKMLANEIIEAFCKRKNKTLIVVTHYKEELPACVNKELKLVKHKYM